MLKSLFIKDIAIVDQLSIDFEAGLTTITGETGAGKSIILNALNLALGERAETSMISTSAEKAEVIASFDIHELPIVRQKMIELELIDEPSDSANTANDAHEEQAPCILRRLIYKNKPSKAFINDRPVTSQTLKEVSAHLMHIQGQHDQRLLGQSEWQRNLLDAHLSQKNITDTVRELFEKSKALDNHINELQDKSISDYEVEILQYQVNELNELNIEENEYETLDQSQRQGRSAQEINTLAIRALELIEIDESSIINNLGDLSNVMLKLEKLHSKGAQWNTYIEQANAVINELSHELNRLNDDPLFDPEQAQKTEKRLSKVFDLARKHKITPETLFQKHQLLIQTLADLSNVDERVAELREELKKINLSYQAKAKVLHDDRVKASQTLSKNISTQMQSLGLKGSEFKIEVQDAQKMSAHGTDQIRFMVRINKGQDFSTLTKSASGGELSRIFMAIQLVMSQQFDGNTLIYDELDTGIGGVTADQVGAKLQELAGHGFQIMCITHLPQIACRGHHQFMVSKQDSKDRTQVSFEPLDKKARISEVARMLGGSLVSKQTLASAKELLEKAHSK